MRNTLLLLLLSACAGVPEYESPYSGPLELYGPPYAVAPGGAATLANVQCNPNYPAATPSPLGLYPCPMPLLSAYSPYGYAAPFYRAPYYAAGFVNHSHAHRGTHHRVHAGGHRGRK